MAIFPVIGSHIKTLNNIPKNSGVGYGKWSSGKVYYADGSFLFYGSVSIDGANGAINIRTEAIANPCIKLAQVPCDADGIILLKSHWLTQVSNSSWPTEYNLTVNFLCSKEPTHRVVVATGEIISNDDGEYLKDMGISYIIVDRSSIG